MNSKIKMTKWILLTVLFSILSVGLLAQTGKDAPKVQKSGDLPNMDQPLPPPPPPPPPPVPPVPPVMGPCDKFPDPPLDLPDLNIDQLDKIKKADLKNIGAMTPLRNQMREKMVHLSTLLTTQPVNMKEADLVADEIGKIHASILKQQIRHDQELRGILTPDQQIIFDSRTKPFIETRR